MAYKFIRSECKLPPAQLEHIDLSLAFFEDRVEAKGTLTLTAREPLRKLALDAKELEIVSCSLPYSYDKKANRLTVELPSEAQAGEAIRVSFACTSHPSDTILDGIYRDTTPPGAPQQYVSQCQQWGFQRIFPVIDDCTAKCTFRTVLEGDARYTHLISNGNKISDETSGGRRRVTYENNVRMAPYLFIACAGTWDELSDEAVYPDGKTVRLEYLVPPGRKQGGRLPLEITKSSVLWQHEYVGYTYPHDTYRTITMDKSNFGGMENTGNTTIITEAALIDETMGDRRLVYAYGVIPHEYEHNHCGSGVTMATPFDMWLNEAYTVNVERAYVATVFDPVFLRLRDVAALRSPGAGPLAMEDTGKFGQIVREGFNDPDEVVDAVTYDKAPEVLNMLEALLGKVLYRKATNLYFSRYDGGNATTEQFLECIAETAGSKLDVPRFAEAWLFNAGYPHVTVAQSWQDGKLSLEVRQSPNTPAAKSPFILPLRVAAVGNDGTDLLDETLVVDKETQTFTLACPQAPAFLSLNRNALLYGTCAEVNASAESVALQTQKDPDLFNRAEAMIRLTDLERARFVRDGTFEPSGLWLETFAAVFANSSIPDGVKASMLSVDETPADRSLLPFVRENPRFSSTMLNAAAKRIGATALAKLLEPTSGQTPAEIERRALQNSALQLLSAFDTPEAWEILKAHLRVATNITDRLNTLAALWQSSCPDSSVLLAEARADLASSLNGYLGYLQVLGSAPDAKSFDAVAREERTAEFSLAHPGMSRALFCPLAQNGDLVWSERGLRWLRETCRKMATVSEYTTLRLLAPLQNFRTFAPDLRESVRAMLAGLQEDLSGCNLPSVQGRLEAYLN